MRKITSWPAILAMALNALWPLIAQAKPPLLVPVCTVGGTTHYVEIPGGTTPVDSQHEHCSLCVAGVGLPTQPAVQAFHTFSFGSPRAAAFSARSFTFVSADARAPPLLS